MSDYTPTIEEMIASWVIATPSRGMSVPVREEAARRALTEHDRQVAEKAIAEVADTIDGLVKERDAPAEATGTTPREHDDRVRQAVLDEAWLAVHIQRFAANSHETDVPGVEPSAIDTFYAGVIRARSAIAALRDLNPKGEGD